MTIATVGSFNVIFLWLTLQQGLDPALEPDQSSDRFSDIGSGSITTETQILHSFTSTFYCTVYTVQ